MYSVILTCICISIVLGGWEERSHPALPGVLTTQHGAPVADPAHSLAGGPREPTLLQDTVLLETLASFNRERIPERVVHAKGGGAFGTFVVTNELSRYCKAKIFSEAGKVTPIVVRFSTVAGERGSADTLRDPRGFAVKFYTEEGNWDLAGLNLPVFAISDVLLFPSFIHSQKRHPATNRPDPTAFWDFVSRQPASLHLMLMLFTDRGGTPDGVRQMHGFGVHTFKMVNATGGAVYVKFHWRSNQGVAGLRAAEAERLAGADPDYAVRDLYEAIARGEFPSWNLFIQVMSFEEAEVCSFNPFDATKVWPHRDHPLLPVGTFQLNRNPRNFHVDVEQVAFQPGNLVPGIEPSPDKLLQGRLFAYGDSQRYRLGPNFAQLPVNRPLKVDVRNYQRDGAMCVTDNQGAAPNYYPNSFGGPEPDYTAAISRFPISGDVARYNSSDPDDLSQVSDFYRKVLSHSEKEQLIENLAGHLKNALPFIQERVVSLLGSVAGELGEAVREQLHLLQSGGQPSTEQTASFEEF